MRQWEVVLELTTSRVETRQRIMNAIGISVFRGRTWGRCFALHPTTGDDLYDLYIGLAGNPFNLMLRVQLQPTDYGCCLVGRFERAPFEVLRTLVAYGWLGVLLCGALSNVPAEDTVLSLIKALLLYAGGAGVGLYLWRAGLNAEWRIALFLREFFEDVRYEPNPPDRPRRHG